MNKYREKTMCLNLKGKCINNIRMYKFGKGNL